MELTQRPVTILIAALGGEGGGVLADWIVAAATKAGYPVQSTSIPGVSQRTGATTYYVEIFPLREELLAGRRPVLALTPTPGDIDVVIASELLEAGRAMQAGYVSPERTTLLASTHRIYAISERMAMADGRFDQVRLLESAGTLAKRAILFDMATLARASGTVINSVLFGALAFALEQAGAPVLSRAHCEEAIGGTKGAGASLKGFAAGYERAADAGIEDTAGPAKRWQGKPSEEVRRRFPAQVHRVIEEGATRLADYQEADYAGLYLDRLQRVFAVERDDRDAAAGSSDWRLTGETARYLALLMAYEDIIRVADLKTRRSRFERVRAEVMAGPGEPVLVTEFLKPGAEEIAAILPARIGRSLLRWASGGGFNFGLRVKTNAVFGFLLMRALARLKPLRRRSLRYGETQALIERWLAAIRAAAAQDPALALEVAECARLVKGYGSTLARGRGNFVRILETLVEGKPELGAIERAAAIREARNSALADPEGRTLEHSLGHRAIAPLAPQAKPIVLVKRPAG